MKKLTMITVLILILTGMVYGQETPGFPLSPTNAATLGRYRSNADNYLRPDSFSGVNFEKYFATAQFNSGRAHLGYATKLGDTYLGIGYSGTFLANIPANSYTETFVTNWGENDLTRIVPVYGAFELGTNPVNNFAVLIGFKSMGIRLGAQMTYQTDSAGNSRIGGTDYNSYEMTNGMITPQIAWSMSKNLLNKGVKPWATVDIGLISNNTKANSAENDYGERVISSQDYMQPEINIGLGGYELYRSEGGFRFGVDFEYRLRMRMYDNEFSYLDGGSYKTGSVSGTVSGLNGGTEINYMLHRIRPALTGQWSGGDVALRFKMNLPVNITNEDRTAMSVDAADNYALKKNGSSYSETAIGVTPELQLAGQWKVHPKFTLNLGGTVGFLGYTSTTRDTETYVNDVLTPNSHTKTVTPSFAGSNATIGAGFTFNATDNVSFEAGGNTTLGSTMDIATVANLLVTLKF